MPIEQGSRAKVSKIGVAKNGLKYLVLTTAKKNKNGKWRNDFIGVFFCGRQAEKIPVKVKDIILIKLMAVESVQEHDSDRLKIGKYKFFIFDFEPVSTAYNLDIDEQYKIETNADERLFESDNGMNDNADYDIPF